MGEIVRHRRLGPSRLRQRASVPLQQGTRAQDVR
jgi:hypothetical protein